MFPFVKVLLTFYFSIIVAGCQLKPNPLLTKIHSHDKLKEVTLTIKGEKMKQKTKRRKRLVEEIEFKLKNNQSLIIKYCFLPDAGLERVVIKNNDGIVHVRAHGRSRFEFHKGKDYPTECDFLLVNPREELLIEDIICSKFWSQFTWGELLKYVKNRKFNKILNRKIKELVQEFETKAATQLNELFKQYKNGSDQ